MPIRDALPAVRSGSAICFTLASALLSIGRPALAGPRADLGSPPPSRVEVVIDTLHGVAISDPYRWLEDPSSPETRRWIDAQNAYSRSALERLAYLPSVKARLSDLMRIDRVGREVWEKGGRFFFWKKRAQDELWILYVREGLSGQDRALVDPHLMSEDHTVGAALLAISRDGRLIAYGIRDGGEDEVVVRILDVDSGEHLPDRLPRALYTGLDFTRENTGLVYGRHDRTMGSRIYAHRMGTDAGQDVEIFGREHPDRWISPLVSDDGRRLVITVYHGWSRSEMYVKDLDEDGPIQSITSDVDARFEPAFAGSLLVVMTNWQAPNRRLVAIDPGHPEYRAWKEIVPEGSDPIEKFSTGGGRLFVHYLHEVKSRIEAYSPDGRLLSTMGLPGPGMATVPAGAWDGKSAFYSFQSFTAPRTTYRFDVTAGLSELWGRDSVPLATDDYVEEQVWFESKDGTRVPMFIVHRKGIERSGDHPTLLKGYGGFNVSLTPHFDPMVALWLEMGGIYAQANLRGGGEFGEAWHRAGMLAKKQNVFDDFIAAAEWLIAYDYTRPSRLAIWGASNGGLLVGAALTQRPELFQAVLCEYPDLDMVRYFEFPNLNRPALAEYGDASDPEQFRFLYAYSPYQRVSDDTEYPAALLTSGDQDTRVPPLQARKMTARLQAATSSDRPIFLLYDTRAGHSGGQPLSTRIEQTALKLSFLCWQLAIEPE